MFMNNLEGHHSNYLTQTIVEQTWLRFHAMLLPLWEKCMQYIFKTNVILFIIKFTVHTFLLLWFKKSRVELLLFG